MYAKRFPVRPGMICMNCGQSVRKIDILNMTDEQKRIVEKIENAFAKLDQIAEQLA